MTWRRMRVGARQGWYRVRKDGRIEGPLDEVAVLAREAAEARDAALDAAATPGPDAADDPDPPPSPSM